MPIEVKFVRRNAGDGVPYGGLSDMTKAAFCAAFVGLYLGGWMYMPCLPGEGRAQTPETRPSMAYSDSMEEPP